MERKQRRFQAYKKWMGVLHYFLKNNAFRLGTSKAEKKRARLDSKSHLIKGIDIQMKALLARLVIVKGERNVGGQY